ncbi:MAG: DedA family protein [Alphaproteobacteria bacterium]|nr:DedA family protein [Alphaproteobacteria bacterium]
MLKNAYNKLIKSMYNWAMTISAKSNAVWALVIISFIESSFFPIPPDIFLIPLILAQRQKAFQLALYCTVASVLGGFLGYGIGFALDEIALTPLLTDWHLIDAFNRFKDWYHQFGAWIVFIAGLTPFPYKVVTIASGAVELNLFVFAIASIISRGMRFFLIAWLLYKWGKPMKDYIEKNLGWLSVLFVILLIGSFLLIKFI